MSTDQSINGQVRRCRREQLKAERERDKAARTKPQPGTVVDAYQIWNLVAQYFEVQTRICETREALSSRASLSRGRSDRIVLH
jgi:hypothetical protein